MKRNAAIEVHLAADGRIDAARLVESGSRRTEGWRRHAVENPIRTFLQLTFEHGFTRQSVALDVANFLGVRV